MLILDGGTLESAGNGVCRLSDDELGARYQQSVRQAGGQEAAKYTVKSLPADCGQCHSELVEVGTRVADPWPEDAGRIYPVAVYTCPNQTCSRFGEPVDYWLEEPA